MKIMVMGAGLVGVASAYYLNKDGHEVTVVDRQPTAANETSFANAGLVAPSHAYTWSSPRAPKILLKSLFRDDQSLRLRLNADPHMWAWCLQFLRNCTAERTRINTGRKLKLCLYSQALLKEVTAETGVAYDRNDRGLLYFYRDRESFARGTAAIKILTDGGLELRVIDREEVCRIEPALAPGKDKIAGGVYAPTDGSGDANKFALGLADVCAKRGVAFRYGTAITGIRTDGDRIAGIGTAQGELTADAYVMALGSYAPILARPIGVKLPVYPVKGYSVTLPIDGSNQAPTVGGVDEDNLLAWSRLGDRLRLTATADFAGYDTAHKPADFRHMLDRARGLFPRGANYSKPRYWAGLRPMTPNGTPIFGRARYRNFYVNAGQGHMGWTMSCGSGSIIAALIAGRPADIDLTGMTYASA
ncbi:MAG: D-amino acid dehydrogenase [Proteobacteria bacterium]|nr:D-amino acid dehydrogenase [Pseudomonadota bacterium]